MAGVEAIPTGTVTFLFTDIEGSTRLAQQYPDKLPDLLARHHEILNESIKAFHGHVFQIVGDAFCAAFDSAARALRAAVRAQQLLQNEAWRPEPLKVRMGIHTGKAEFQEDGSYQGYLTLSRAQRLMSAAHGGQVLVSLAAHDLIGDDMPGGAAFRDMGERRLRDMVRPERIYQLVIPNLRADFPPIKALDVYLNNLPAQITSFIGREREIVEIRRALDEHRLLTLTGSGGVGKTRLSLQVAATCLDQFSGGVWFAELAPVAAQALISQTLLSIFNLRGEGHRDALDLLINHLREKSALLILDNCEHLIEACAKLSEALLFGCPKLCILATSREPLGIAGEVAYRVASLDTSDPQHLPSLDELEKVDSIELFMERAAAAKPGFRLTMENAAFIAQVCSRLDGIPLAIELAAARVKVLSPDQIASRLDDRFRLLTQGSRTALPRHQTLRATIDWSYSLLSEQEKLLFRRLAVFVGGWTLEAAEQICGDGSGRFDVLEVLSRLVDKSLVSLEESSGAPRYRRLETIRQYSRERLFETDEVEILKDRHLDFFVRFAELVDENLKGGNQMAWQRRMSVELDNLRAALDWGLGRNPYSALRIAGASNLFWTAGGFSSEGFRWTQQALEQVDKIPLPEGITIQQLRLARARALRGLTRLYLSLGDNAGAKRVAEESVALYRDSQDGSGLAFALVVLAYPLEFLGERARAEEVLQESYAIARSEGDVYVMCRALNRLARVIVDLYQDLDLSQGYLEESIRLAREGGLRSQEAQAMEILGLIAARRGDFEAARAHYKESLRAYEEIGATFNVTLEETNLAHLERQLGKYEAALDYYRETIVAFRDIGQRGAVAHQLECFGFIALAQNQVERALKLFAAANSLRETSGTPMTPDEQVYFDAQLARLHENLDSKKFASIWAQAGALTMEQAIDLALGPS